jgi:hypothetical protein
MFSPALITQSHVVAGMKSQHMAQMVKFSAAEYGVRPLNVLSGNEEARHTKQVMSYE